MAAAGYQATVQGSVRSTTLISALTNNTGVPTMNTQGLQLPPTPPMQPVHLPIGVAVVSTQTALQKRAVVIKLLAINYAQTKEDLEG